MAASANPLRFSEEYGRWRVLRAGNAATARESPATVEASPAPIPETVLQCIWYDQLFNDAAFQTDDGRGLHVLSPGWWNHGEGPDFHGAQIEFNGRLRSGDVEIHFKHVAWTQHGHHLDSRYNNVMLVVVLEEEPPSVPPVTLEGKPIPTVCLSRFLEEDIQRIADRLLIEDYPYRAASASGQCSAFVQERGIAGMTKVINLAGEWRMLNKARALRERMDRAGAGQAVYEQFMGACGFGHFKNHFLAIARQFPYDRARQLAQQDPHMLEAALLQVAGLLPDSLPQEVPHFARLRALRQEKLAGLGKLPLEWKRVGLRPNNNPERRLAGATMLIARTSGEGLLAAIEDIWQADAVPVAQRRQFEDLFPKPMGFWADHCTWTGKKMATPSSPLGEGRIRSIIGNVFIPTALALARQRRDRLLEERALKFFAALPKEPDNHVVRIMIPRLLGPGQKCKCDFRFQQGLLQVRQDWCEANPSCHNCSMINYLSAATG